jgi:hypothetical protein
MEGRAIPRMGLYVAYVQDEPCRIGVFVLPACASTTRACAPGPRGAAHREWVGSS